MLAADLLAGRTRSCGCLRAERARASIVAVHRELVQLLADRAAPRQLTIAHSDRAQL